MKKKIITTLCSLFLITSMITPAFAALAPGYEWYTCSECGNRFDGGMLGQYGFGYIVSIKDEFGIDTFTMPDGEEPIVIKSIEAPTYTRTTNHTYCNDCTVKAMNAYLSAASNPGDYNSTAVVDHSQTTFSVTVPTSLPIQVNQNGEVSVATDSKIVNNSFGPVAITSIKVQGENGWNLVDYNKDFSKEKMNLKEFGFNINNTNVPTSGICPLSNFSSIPGNSEINFSYMANIAPQSSSISNLKIAAVIITMGWDNA